MYMNSVTLIGFSVIFFYSLIQILNFYGIGQDTYGPYVLFWGFLVISILILPNDYPKV
jgi:hypothetical protein